MKLERGRIAAFLRDPGPCRVVVLYGEDGGLIRERAEALIRLIAGGLDDPFRVAELTADDGARLTDEAATLSLTGGRRAVRMRDAGNALTPHVRALLKTQAPALVVMEAPSLGTPSSLRTLVDAAPDAVSIACYPEEGAALEDTIRSTLRALGAVADPDAVSWLGAQLGADRASTRAELEKLALYAGQGGRVDLAAAMECVGDLSGLSLDDALFAATDGDVAAADRALELAMAEGAAPVQVLRMGLGHLRRLHRIRAKMEAEGLGAAEAARTARPPIFYRRVAPFTRALGLWPQAALAAAMAGLTEAEKGCKRTGWPDEVLCRNAILAVARRAAVERRRGRR
jgi:DNA polymerase-3 subunit delta